QAVRPTAEVIGGSEGEACSSVGTDSAAEERQVAKVAAAVEGREADPKGNAEVHIGAEMQIRSVSERDIVGVSHRASCSHVSSGSCVGGIMQSFADHTIRDEVEVGITW